MSLKYSSYKNFDIFPNNYYNEIMFLGSTIMYKWNDINDTIYFGYCIFV